MLENRISTFSFATHFRLRGRGAPSPHRELALVALHVLGYPHVARPNNWH